MTDYSSLPIVGMEDDEDYSKLPIVGGDVAPQNDYSNLPVVGGEPDPVQLTREQILSNPEKVDAIRKYMVQRKSVDWETAEPEKLFDTYMGHMRFLNTNEMRTLSEALYIQRANDEQKATAANAYSVYDEIAPFWSSGEGAGALVDYGKAILTSPSTYIGAVAGKILSRTGTAAAKTALMQAAKQAAAARGPAAGKAVIAAGVRSNALKVGALGTAVDTSLGVGQDYVLQKEVMMDSDAQDDYSMAQTAITALGGLAGGAIGMIPELRKGSLGITADAIKTSKAQRAAKSKGLAASRIKASVDKIAEEVKLGSGSMDWREAVSRGAESNPTIGKLANDMGWFFDVNNPDSLVRIIVDSGAPMDFSDEAPRFTEQVLGFVNDLPEKDLKEINAVLEPATGLKLGQLIDHIAVGQSRGGQMLNLAGQAKKYAEEFANISRATKKANQSVVNDLLTEPKPVPENPEYAQYLAGLWRRMVVSHPATTAVNVQGWGAAYLARSMAEMVNGSLLGTAGLVGKSLGMDWGPEALQNAKNAWANQIFKAKTLLDPYESKETFEELLNNAPPKIKERMTAEAFGGIMQNDRATAMYGITNPNMAVRGAEKVADLAAKASLIHVQDVWTKTFSGLGELDYAVRKQYGKGLTDLVQSGEYYKITDDMWNQSTKALLQDTFSMDYTKGKNVLNRMADVVETVSNAPYLGFLFPFGRFMNNNIAFTLQYSPLAFIPMVGRMKKLGVTGFVNNTDDIGTDIGKAIVGTVGLATMINHSMQAREKGLQWFEAEDSDGSITSEQNMAPVANYRLLGRLFDRIGDRLINGEAVPTELWRDLASQMGPQQWARELTGDTPISSVIEMMGQAKTEEEKVGFEQLLMGALESLGGQVVAGYTRPIDPYNKVAGLLTETDAAIDRRQADPGGEKLKLELTRYTDNIFESMLGEGSMGTPLRQASRPEGDIHNPNDMATFVGRKEVLPKNYTDKLLGMLDRPAYLLDQRSGNPAADRFMNETVAPLLNERSKWLMQDETFINGNMAIKQYMVDNMLRTARKDVRTLLTEGLIGTSDDRLDAQKRVWLSTPQPLRDQAKKDLGITTNDRDLTEDELRVLKDYVGSMRKFLNGRVEQKKAALGTNLGAAFFFVLWQSKCYNVIGVF